MHEGGDLGVEGETCGGGGCDGGDDAGGCGGGAEAGGPGGAGGGVLIGGFFVGEADCAGGGEAGEEGGEEVGHCEGVLRG